ncbi:hypothetical protein [Liquorilactobacillus uvarum]|uniref:Uncharacterized protein n=1 Tax=Liquorilactobacillus uvarum DSM 19971 TaxID=1423812 RepID=A0A0R1Q795_9LACO|nr:hypothetical protein [Liquorilactobacillus uvarum]KRL38772.1 hypothetical protein FD20_GL000840 [Liquorilactobacillus uvarum DSM 19971]
MDLNNIITPENTTIALEAGKALLSEVSIKLERARANKNKQETIDQLNIIITKLIDNQNALVQNQTLINDKLESQTISAEDISYISEKIIPILKRISDPDKFDPENFEKIKALLSPELIKTLQLLGFNLKEALGKPATQALQNFILNIANKDALQERVQIENLKYQNELAKIAQDEDSFNRYQEFCRKN